MKTKEEVIQEHYLKHISEEDFSKLKIREDGQAIMYNEEGVQLSPNFMFLGFTQQYVSENIDGGIDIKTNEMVWRPKSLSGIEDNRGWVNIHSEKDYPNPGQYWVIDTDGDMLFTDMEMFSEMFDWSGITHYKKVDKPKTPLY